MRFILFILLLTVFVVGGSARQSFPKHEVRAVWITTVNALDWPPSLDVAEQQRSLKEIVEKLHTANFNTIYFQARGRGDVMYKSQLEPWSVQLTGILGEDPGWDPLAFVIREAHARAMEVHAWFSTFLVKTSGGKTPESQPRHLILQHPSWVHVVDGEWWVVPGIPEVRAYTIDIVMELLRNYDVDGIQFDYIRYPIKQLRDEESYRRYGNSQPKADWRRENINSFVRAVYDSATALNPTIKIGSAPIGIYNSQEFKATLHSYEDLYQDSRRWLREGKLDYVVPQVYWSLGQKPGNPDFAHVVHEWSSNVFGRQLIIGVGAYKNDVAAQLPLLIDTTRSYNLSGNAFFRYSNVRQKLDVGKRYLYPANIPPMPWKDSIPPNPPQHLIVTGSSPDNIKLRWDPPLPARDGDRAKFYNIYRSVQRTVDITTAEHLFSIQTADQNFFTDTSAHSSSEMYDYEITALDEQYNESGRSIPASIQSLLTNDSTSVQPSRFYLFESYPNPASDMMFIPYEVPQSALVSVGVFDENQNEIVNVVHSVQTAGRHIVSARVAGLQDGLYTIRLITGTSTVEKKVVIRH